MSLPRTGYFLSFLLVLAVAGASASPMGSVAVSDGYLSVEVQSASLHDVITEIGRQAGFSVDISPGVPNTLLSTTFKGLEIQRGIQRLFTLVRQKNYFIHYGQDGLIDRIEIHGDTTGPSVTRREPWRRPSASAPSPRPPRSSASRPRRIPPTAIQQPSQPVPIPSGLPDDLSGDMDTPGLEAWSPDVDEGVAPPEMEEEAGVPYIPPRRAPAYIPPSR